MTVPGRVSLGLSWYTAVKQMCFVAVISESWSAIF